MIQKISNYSNDDWLVPKNILDCKILKFISIYFIILFVTSITSNFTLIWILKKNKRLLNQYNILVLSLAGLSLIGTLVSLPIKIASSFSCR